MRAEAARLMVEMAVDRGLREIRQGDCRRAVRSLVEDACRWARRGYPGRLFDDMRRMFRAEGHPYFELMARAAAAMDKRAMTCFAFNLCYESWVQGAKLLRRDMRATGEKRHWLLEADLDRQDVTGVMGRLDEALTHGTTACLMRAQVPPVETLRALCACYPRCALMLMTPDEALTEDVVAALDGADNLLIIAWRRTGAFVSAAALRSHRRLYALCRPLDETEMLRLMDSGDLSCPGDEECPLPVFLPDPEVPAALRGVFNQWLENRRQHPTQPLFPVDLDGDPERVLHLIYRKDADEI